MTNARETRAFISRDEKFFKMVIPNMNGNCCVVVGAQWGNEGKGKLVSELSQKAEVCARFNGGANNVHTICVDSSGLVSTGRPSEESADMKTLTLRLFPLGVTNKSCKIVFGNGMVIHLPTLIDEIKSIQSSFDMNVLDRIYISTRAHLVFDIHQEVDRVFEDIRENKLGTSQKGIGPSYSTKTIRNGIRLGDLFSSETVVKEKLTELVSYFRKGFTHSNSPADIDKVVSEHMEMLSIIRTRIVDTVAIMSSFLNEKKTIICEGSNSVMSDIDFGTYPYVTSSNTTPGSASIGLGIPPTKISKIFGVCKAYTTRAQHWFPSVIDDKVASLIREAGHEYGTSGGKPRLVGWLDLVQVKYAAGISGFDSLLITKLDALSGLDKISFVTEYKGTDVDSDGYPSTEEGYLKVSPILETMDGWKCSLAGITRIADLPENAKAYLKRIEIFVGVPIEQVQLGLKHDDIIA